jgi:hypothetical protein
MCPLWTVVFNIKLKLYALLINGKNILSFIDSGLLYRGALYGRFDCIYVYMKIEFFNNELFLFGE